MLPRFRQPWGVRVCTIAGAPRVIICVQPGIYLNSPVEFQGAACLDCWPSLIPLRLKNLDAYFYCES